jgi:hypothetical protein
MASSDRPIIIGAAAAVLVVAAGLYYYFYVYREGASVPPAQRPAVNLPAPAPSNAPPAVEHPVPQSPTAGTAPLPALNDSDQPLHDALVTVPGAAAVDKMLEPQNLIRHIVASVDNLPRKKLAVDLRPIHATPGQFQVVSAGDHMTIAPQNAQRYAPFVDLVRQVDERQLADLYFHFYPLFQQAYEDLGYPSEYFNDRVIEVLDNLLATPDVKGPIELVQPNVMFQYADPQLEALSAGQKTLLRMGPANAALIKEKLRALRTLLATHAHGAGHSQASP